jgi:putative hydrolase of the HAD superfamily
MHVKAVLFDLDNTLIDFYAMKKAGIDAALDAMLDAGLKTNRNAAEETIQRIYAKRGMEYQRVFQEMMKQIIGRVNYKALGAGVVAYRQAKESRLIPYPGVRKTLEALRKKGLKLGVVSDAPRIQAWTRLAAMKLHKSFDAVVAFEDTLKKKPSQAPFKVGARALGEKPGSTMFVGESLRRDIAGAKKAGMITCWARYGAKQKTRAKGAGAKPDFTIRRAADVLRLV